MIGGERNLLEGDLAGGYYVRPTVFKGHNKMRIFQEEIFGPVLSVTTFKDEEEALAIANDTLYGLGAGFGLVTVAVHLELEKLFRQVVFGLIVIMLIRHMLPLVVINSLELGVKHIK